MQKKIALVVGRYDFLGGLENYARNLALALSKSGFAVSILTKGKGLVKNKNPKIVFLKKRGKISFLDLLSFNYRLKKYLKKKPHDLVVSMERIFHQDVLRAGFGVHKIFLKQKKKSEPLYKKILTNLNPLHYLLLSLEKKAFEDPKLKLLFVNSLMVQNEILQNFSLDPKKIVLIRNGITLSSLQKRVASKDYRFLFIGNGYQRKGLSYLLKALFYLERKDWQLDVIGKEKNLYLYQKEAKQYHIEDKVIFHGPKKELLSFYSEADALIIPSLYDPCSNVTLEALSMGLFVITSSFNGGKELLHPFSGIEIEDLFSPIKVKKALEIAFTHPKTEELIQKRRDSVKELDFTKQLSKMVEEISKILG